MNKEKISQAATNYRVQRLIRMGEWLEEHEAILIALFDSIDDAHTDAMESEGDDTIILEGLINKQLAPLRGMMQLLTAIRFRNDWGVVYGAPVTTIHKMACPEHKVQQILPGVNMEEGK